MKISIEKRKLFFSDGHAYTIVVKDGGATMCSDEMHEFDFSKTLINLQYEINQVLDFQYYEKWVESIKYEIDRAGYDLIKRE